jgi:hypothetical protein
MLGLETFSMLTYNPHMKLFTSILIYTVLACSVCYASNCERLEQEWRRNAARSFLCSSAYWPADEDKYTVFSQEPSEAYKVFIASHPLPDLNDLWYLGELADFACAGNGEAGAIYTLLEHFKCGIRLQNAADIVAGRKARFHEIAAGNAHTVANGEVVNFLQRKVTNENCKAFLKAALALKSCKQPSAYPYLERHINGRYINFVSKIVLDFLARRKEFRTELGPALYYGVAITTLAFSDLMGNRHKALQKIEGAFIKFAGAENGSRETTLLSQRLMQQLIIINRAVNEKHPKLFECTNGR